MTFLSLQPLSVDRLPDAVALDQRCFGGLWTLDSYRREMESPNSELLVLMAEAEGRRQKAEGAEGAGEAEGQREQREKGGMGGWEDGERGTLNANFKNADFTAQNSPLPLSPHPSLLTPLSSPLLGLGCYWAILEEAHITMLAINPLCQHQGLGQALLYALLASAQTRGLERATLEVRASNASAIALYQKFGFREAGRRRRYYPDNGEDALVLWLGGLHAPDFAERLRVWQQQVCDRLYRADWQLAACSDR